MNTLTKPIPILAEKLGTMFANAYFVPGCSKDNFVIATRAGHEVLTATKCKNGVTYFDPVDSRYQRAADELNRASLQYGEIVGMVGK